MIWGYLNHIQSNLITMLVVRNLSVLSPNTENTKFYAWWEVVPFV